MSKNVFHSCLFLGSVFAAVVIFLSFHVSFFTPLSFTISLFPFLSLRSDILFSLYSSLSPFSFTLFLPFPLHSPLSPSFSLFPFPLLYLTILTLPTQGCQLTEHTVQLSHSGDEDVWGPIPHIYDDLLTFQLLICLEPPAELPRENKASIIYTCSASDTFACRMI